MYTSGNLDDSRYYSFMDFVSMYTSASRSFTKTLADHALLICKALLSALTCFLA
jgi:hypothetical protein